MRDEDSALPTPGDSALRLKSCSQGEKAHSGLLYAPLLGDVEPFCVHRELAIVLTKVSCRPGFSPLAQPVWPSAVFPI